MSSKRRVVVTGMGVVTPLGVGKHHVWEKLTRGQVGISSLKGLSKFDRLPCKVAAFVPFGKEAGQLDADKHAADFSTKSLSTGTTYSLIAAKEAIEDADWQPTNDVDLDRTGVSVGMGMSPFEDIFTVGNNLAKDNYSKISPHFVPRILTNMAAGHISIKYGFRGANHSVSTACATGAHAIGDAYRLVSHGDCDVMICGGTEASINPLAIAGFCRMRALSTRFNDTPAESSRPFDLLRDGFVMGEGAGILVVEELQHALDRKANICAEILGYGMSGDGHHVTAPRPDGRGAYLCMKAALNEARLSPSDVGYINAHATSTPLGDAIEIRAIQQLLIGVDNASLMISSTKGATGHLLGAAGSVEAIFAIMACHTGIVPPTVNLTSVDCQINGLNLVARSPVHFASASNGHSTNVHGRRVALTNSFGFGGTNASLCFSNFIHS